MSNERTPVIVGVGELSERPASLDRAREPADLMAEALRLAEHDAGAPLLQRIDGLEIINQISWPYADTCAAVSMRLASGSRECTYHPVGGQTPILAVHRAALAIQEGRWRSAAICGAEAEASVALARQTAFELAWSPAVPDFKPIRGAYYQRPIARSLDFATPAHVYPFYEYATRKAWNQSLADAERESGTIWANNAAIARGREAAWLKREIDASEIVRASPENRMIAWPYTKLMMANPRVNQGAAVIMCSLGLARELGIARDRLIYVRGGAAADERRDYLERETFDRSEAMEWALEEARSLCGNESLTAAELYSCFPVVPKMARRVLGLEPDAQLTVTGGLTFFGAPLNNYMTHGAVAMVERLRRSGGNGLLYGQGEYVTKHHALLLSSLRPEAPLTSEYRRPEPKPPAPISETYTGAAMGKAATILYDRDGSVRHGGAIVRTADGQNMLTRIPRSDEPTLRAVTSETSIVGQIGHIRTAADGIPEWSVWR